MSRVGAILIAVVAVLVGCAEAPSHKRLLERHIKARGGRDALEGLQVVERIGRFTFHRMEPAAEGTYHTCIEYPSFVAIEIEAGPVRVHQVLGRNGALECDPGFVNCSPATASVEDELRGTAAEANREELHSQLPEEAQAEILYENGIAIGYSYSHEGVRHIEEFDPVTGLEKRRVRGSRERRYGEWRDAGGVLIPMLIEDFEESKPSVTIELSSATHTVSQSSWCASRFAVGSGNSGSP